MDYFDYEGAAQEAGISADQLAQIVVMMEREFPHDPMMCELHVLRACMAVRDDRVTIQQILGPSAAAPKR